MKKILFITSFPEKNLTHGKKTVGIASYAKNTITAIQNAAKEQLHITILAEEIQGESPYKQKNLSVKRIWKRDSLTVFPKILKEILKNHKSEKTIVLEFEVAMFGNFLTLLPLPLFLLILRLLGKRIIFISHQIIPDINEIAPHINITRNSRTAYSVNFMIQIFYRTIFFLSDKIIVFEDALKQKLAQFGNSKKIIVIPHGVEKFETIPTKTEARKRLNIKKNEFVVTSFGYLAWYKGSDWLAHSIQEVNKKKSAPVSLLLAGGPNLNHIDKKYYQKYLARILNTTQSENITVTGFIPQKDISLYYQASDVIIFPYRAFMSSSGPLSLAFSFKKPFLISKHLAPILKQDDVKNALKEVKLSEERIIFTDTESLSKKITAIKNTKLKEKITTLSTILAKKRSWEIIGQRYYEELTA